MDAISTQVTEVHRLPLSKQLLLSMGDDERRLVLLFGHAANEIATLSRLLLFSIGGEYEHDISVKVSAGRSGTVIRLLAGKIWECHELIKTRLQLPTSVGARYVPLMLQGGQTAYELVKKQGGGDAGRVLAALRNQHSFHFPPDKDIDAAILDLPDDESLEAFISENGDANYFQMSEAICMLAATRVIKEGDFQSRMGKVADIVIATSRELTRFLNHYTGTVLEHAGALQQATTMALVPAVSMDDISIPPISVRLTRNNQPTPKQETSATRR